MQSFWLFERVHSGVNEQNVSLSREVLEVNDDDYPPGMTILLPTATQPTAAAWMWAKELEDRRINSGDGQHSSSTVPNAGGILTAQIHPRLGHGQKN
ncbi:hypothetical protein RBB50_008624 [Rhinocladiella similis]